MNIGPGKSYNCGLALTEMIEKARADKKMSAILQTTFSLDIG